MISAFKCLSDIMLVDLI